MFDKLFLALVLVLIVVIGVVGVHVLLDTLSGLSVRAVGHASTAFLTSGLIS